MIAFEKENICKIPRRFICTVVSVLVAVFIKKYVADFCANKQLSDFFFVQFNCSKLVDKSTGTPTVHFPSASWSCAPMMRKPGQTTSTS